MVLGVETGESFGVFSAVYINDTLTIDFMDGEEFDVHQAARHNRLQRRSKNSKGRRILKDQSPEHRPFDNREVGGGILWD